MIPKVPGTPLMNHKAPWPGFSGKSVLLCYSFNGTPVHVSELNDGTWVYGGFFWATAEDARLSVRKWGHVG